MNEVDKVINIALKEIGYIEKKNMAQLDSKTLNIGNNNFTKYARDLDNITDFYNNKKQGSPWCAIFVDWCLVKALGVDRARSLLCYPKKSAGSSCNESIKYYKKNKRFIINNPTKGDQVFFKQGHTGIVYAVDENRIYTIEGNTAKSSLVITNGGEVCKKRYNLNDNNIIGYGHIDYITKNNNSNLEKFEKFGYKFGSCEAFYKSLKVKAIRKEPNLSNNIKLVKEISEKLRPGLTSKRLNAQAHIKIGCILTILEIIEDSNGLIWGRNYDGWLVLCEKTGAKQLVFVRNK